MSLKAKLEEYIIKSPEEIVPVYEIEAICKVERKKISNGERRLRESLKVVAVKNSKKYIIGYMGVK